MKETFNRYGIRETDHTVFGGIINYSDFNTNYRGRYTDGSVIAGRILRDRKFDEQCRKNIEERAYRQRKTAENDSEKLL